MSLIPLIAKMSAKEKENRNYSFIHFFKPNDIIKPEHLVKIIIGTQELEMLFL